MRFTRGQRVKAVHTLNPKSARWVGLATGTIVDVSNYDGDGQKWWVQWDVFVPWSGLASEPECCLEPLTDEEAKTADAEAVKFIERLERLGREPIPEPAFLEKGK